jgi:hypothetical protein
MFIKYMGLVPFEQCEGDRLQQTSQGARFSRSVNCWIALGLASPITT